MVNYGFIPVGKKTGTASHISVYLGIDKELTFHIARHTFEWLKSTEVRKIFRHFTRTLQNLRINGTLPYSRIGGTIYYKSADIEKLMHGDEKKR